MAKKYKVIIFGPAKRKVLGVIWKLGILVKEGHIGDRINVGTLNVHIINNFVNHSI